VKPIKTKTMRGRATAALMLGTVLGSGTAAFAQDAGATTAAAAQPAPATPAAAQGTIRSIRVTGAQRLEPETVRAYSGLNVGQAYDNEVLDEAIRTLIATELLADVGISGGETGNIVLEVRENPVINRIILEGNKRLKSDKITPEIKLAPRQIFTRTKVRTDVDRIIELYRRQGRYAATVEPKVVTLDQNRVDVVFEISEGPKSKVRAINIIGNEAFGDGRLRSEMATKESSFFSFFGSGDSYDPDRLAYDQQKLRQYYLTQGYADFRVVSAVAELTPDKRDFIITYVVEEGDRYKFGDVTIESELRDFKPQELKSFLPMKAGDWFNAKQVEDTVTLLNETAGLFGYAFADIRPNYRRDKDAKTMTLTFNVGDAPRTYIERIDIAGNTYTQDKVLRREFRLNEGDAFNTIRVKRSRDRIQSLGFFQENIEIEQRPGSAPDRIILGVDVEERATGELQLSAGFSSLENFILNLSIAQRNFRGKGQTVRASANYSTYSKSLELGFTEPYLFDRNIGLGGEVYRRDLSSFNILNNERNTTYEQVTTGGGLTVTVPVTEYILGALRYNLNFDDVSLDRNTFFTDGVCDPLRAGRFLCDAIGKRTTSAAGYSLLFSNLNSAQRPSAGQRIVLTQDFAGLGGDVKYIRTRLDGTKYFNLFNSGFIFSAHAEGGYIHPLQKSRTPSQDAVRLTDRFFGPQLRGFDIRGIGPRVQRLPIAPDGTVIMERDRIQDDAVGGRAYYMARAEIEVPLGAGARDLGLRPSAFIDVGSLFGLRDLTVANGGLTDFPGFRDCLPVAVPGQPTAPGTTVPGNGTCPEGTTPGAVRDRFTERYVGDSPKPRVSIGVGVNWNSPFGPFRIDLARALIKQKGDDTKLFNFNVGTAF